MMSKLPDSSAMSSTSDNGIPHVDAGNFIDIAGQLRLPPANKLKVLSSNFFARDVQANIQRIKDGGRPLRLRLPDKRSVVIIDNKTYDTLLHMRTQLIKLVEQMEQIDVDNSPR